ncbi:MULTISPECIES: Rv0909 family putative TA system antitoxin [unclassified Actinomyces]|uniref:Rv0909 family putative TA system antitoxin n=1 Tax=unclassified Actinomyces TaxID=2609248 RepID=UPI002016BA49|nr:MULTISPECIES: Rv0909 family putative TA system antitoxin [unclassified Actinomyces]MCL3778147.1 antitoxin [Actinomyces sp. AC-20-1]MCL3789264.1 antitoxin [Actinomyces sp. 187325]MCL3791684.1 antitoxin [Actinomyces sp. 186855]MCL3794276.1 antitoxin [Actinomyces sp. 217892]
MGLDDLKNKAAEALSSDALESVSDTVLDKVADAAKTATGGKLDGQIDAARAAADEKIGK